MLTEASRNGDQRPFSSNGGRDTVTAMTSTAELDPKLAPIVAKLVTQSNGTYDEAFVHELVLHVAAEFEGAPVQDYLAVLVEKEAADEMRRLHGLRQIAS